MFELNPKRFSVILDESRFSPISIAKSSFIYDSVVCGASRFHIKFPYKYHLLSGAQLYRKTWGNIRNHAHIIVVTVNFMTPYVNIQNKHIKHIKHF